MKKHYWFLIVFICHNILAFSFNAPWHHYLSIVFLIAALGVFLNTKNSELIYPLKH